jgi:hypothetical protein
MRDKRIFEQKNWKKGQSLIELTLVLTILLTLLTGMVEFGNLLNQYITVVDAAREGARFASNDDPFIRVVTDGPPPCTNPFCDRGNFYTNIDQIIEGAFDDSGERAPDAKGALSPILLDPAKGDDVVVSVFSMTDGVALRFPKDRGEDGWSYYESKGLGGQKSSFSTAELENRLDASAPDSGMVLVEIYYNYDQILKLWSFIGVPDPIRVHAYSIMPLSAAEATPTPGP